ncbi:MAG: beta-galactosidase [Oscillospiraceae bacterium]|jgi:beta-galactosidase|nr:beta-galactosidase [Oscillospiraceae bacterium]
MNQVMLNREGITIRGKKTILLCASLFYFRIPRAEWEDRIRKLKDAGYNCIDVYFPWNFHEPTPGVWDFENEKDIDGFLQLAERYQLYVIARPGPYICSEWDGGALPAWLLADPSIQVRQNNPAYLEHVRRWYGKIIPYIAKHQIDRGGTVILMQLENELDFFYCADPRGYISTLRDMARKLGITVPLFCCAGQSDAEGAFGWAGGVHLTFNFYGDVCNASFGDKIHYYSSRMREIDQPLMISETDCDHLLLRRELAAGAKLIGPYNQVGGTNFGFTGSVNNWGKDGSPVSFLTTRYAGDCMIGSAGELQEQYFEGRRFAGLIHTFGPALASAESVQDSELTVTHDFASNPVFYRLDLAGGGSLVCVPNLSEKKGAAAVSCRGTRLEAAVPGRSAPFFPFDIPLSLFHREGTLVCSNGELENCSAETGRETIFTFWTESASPFARFVLQGEPVCLTPEHPAQGGIRAVWANDRELRELPLCGVPVPVSTKCSQRVDFSSFQAIRYSENLMPELTYTEDALRPLESQNIFRGAGSYGFPVEGLGVLLVRGADLIGIYRNGRLEETCAPAGCTKYHLGKGEYRIFTAVWGHSNFPDARQPALMLDSSRGLEKAVDVLSVCPLEDGWLCSGFSGSFPVSQKPVETVLSVNAWSTAHFPARTLYRKKVFLDRGCDSYFLELPHVHSEITLYVDGEKAGMFNPFDPFLDFSSFVSGKEEAELALDIRDRNWGLPLGTPALYSGRKIERCGFAGLPEEKLAALANKFCQFRAGFPFKVPAGEIIHVDLPFFKVPKTSCYLKVDGHGLFILAFVGNRPLGRVLLWKDAPFLVGEPDCLYLPKSFLGKETEVRFLVMGLEENAELCGVRIESID